VGGAGEHRKLSAVSYAASSARVCRGISVNVEFARPARMAARTRPMNVASVASLVARLTYSDSLLAIVSVTPRLTSMLYPVRSACRCPTSVTTGTAMASASSVPLTPPYGIGSSTKSTSS